MSDNRPKCDDCGTEMHECPPASPEAVEGWSCDDCGWSVDIFSSEKTDARMTAHPERERVEITPELLEELHRKAAVASAGPWIYSQGHVKGPAHGDGPHRADLVWMVDCGSSCDECTTWDTREPTGKYIAALHPAVVLALVERIRELEREVDATRAHYHEMLSDFEEGALYSRHLT